MYKLLRSLLFCFDPEKVHYFSMNCMKAACSIPVVKNLLRRIFQPVPLPLAASQKNKVSGPTPLFNLPFTNIIGLGAGFDKNALYLRELETLGFGFVEIGTVTPLSQAGNDQPRLFRLPADQALINRMGFNNDGAITIAARLQQWRKKNPNSRLIIGGNIGKNKNTPNELAWKDYLTCFHTLHPYVDYFVVNVSSPNTPGLRALQEKESLRHIFNELSNSNHSQSIQRPVLLKIAPDLSKEQVDDVISLIPEIELHGLIISNTSIAREGLFTNATSIEKMGAGGLSGKPVKEKSTALIRYVHEKTNGQVPIIGSGGIFTGEDAAEKIQAGASLLQVWTGFIYEGPTIVQKISSYLAARAN